ncbi:GGDEF domain-containing protein [Aphanothece hegewaldii CCALA 016]|uniref:GGDEF domain-containing protein n=1 Tax=Aphanothece hegewaldii CCALA 016 TaxID=2107694 RepID=A0A2T1M342_9CHRO|nr:EAL domain-containing protein [Aphanothece hegewaldii]PSF39245.1 GGDEF domain-containing protein [Aphanothece hegewaldii CCALA 016]
MRDRLSYMLNLTELKTLTQSTLSVLELLRSPIWIFNLEKNQIEWANNAALQLWQIKSIDELFSINWNVSYPFTETELEQITHKKSIIKRWFFNLKDKHLFLDGICTSIEQDKNHSIFLIEGNDLSLEQHIYAWQIQTQKELKYRLDFEQIIATLSTHFISLDSQKINQGINHALQIIGEFEKVERSYVFIFSDSSLKFLSNTHEWCANGIASYIDILQNIETGMIPWFTEKIKKNEIIHIPDVSNLSVEANTEKELLEIQSIKSLLCVPIIDYENILGFVGFDAVNNKKYWSKDSINLLNIFAEMLAQTLHRQKFEIEIKEHQRKLAHLINSLPGIVFKADNDHQWSMKYLSEGCLKLTGYEPEELIKLEKLTYNDLTHPEDLPRVINTINESILQGNYYEVEYRIYTKSGEEKWVWEKGSGVFDDLGNVKRIEGFITDITQLKRTENALIKAEFQYRSIFENITQGIFQSTSDGQYITANPALAQIYGYDSPEELINTFTNLETQLYVEPQQRDLFIKRLKQQGYIKNFEIQVYRKDKSIIWTSETARAVYDENGIFLYYEGTVEDITLRRLTETKLLHDAFYDKLTDLPNRTWLMLQLTTSIIDFHQDPEKMYAVLFIDLDSFKVVNDSLGHLVGDELIKQVANRLKNELRAKDKIARFGGDEFVVILESLQDINEVIKIAERIKEQFKRPFILGNDHVFTGASIGITMSSFGYNTPTELLRDADIAMYQAKAKGKSCYVIFNPEMKKAAFDRLQIENDLRQAIEEENLQLYYQPIISLSTGKLMGFEALIRWSHPSRNWIIPHDFIPIAEETGLIDPLSIWILKEACHQLKKWKVDYPQAANLVINVNLSAQQLREIRLIHQLMNILEQTGLEGKDLKLEITESCFLEVIEKQNGVVEQLKALGVGLCIDDFGVGYSSLSRLHEFSIDILKIDRSFIHRLDNNQTAIVQTIITLAHNLGFNVVAEGIETQKQLEQLKQLKCELGQGYLFSKPLDRNAATQYICSSQSFYNTSI